MIRSVERWDEPPSCTSTLFFADTSNNAFDLSSTTRMSFFPITCNVGVVYGAEGVRSEAQMGPGGTKPEIDTQNELGMWSKDMISYENNGGKTARNEMKLTRGDAVVDHRRGKMDRPQVFPAVTQYLNEPFVKKAR